MQRLVCILTLMSSVPLGACESGPGDPAEEEGGFRCGLPPGDYVVRAMPREDMQDHPVCAAEARIFDGAHHAVDEVREPWDFGCADDCRCEGGTAIDADGLCVVSTTETCPRSETRCERTTDDQGGAVGECVREYRGDFDGVADCHIILRYERF